MFEELNITSEMTRIESVFTEVRHLGEKGKVEDEKAPVHFITYRMTTARGVMFQMVFYAIHKEHKGMVIGNYNCFYKDLPIWENVIKATVSYFTFE